MFSKQDLFITAVNKYGSAEVLRYLINDSIESLNTMRIGISEDKPMLAMKDFEVIYENLRQAKQLLGDKSNRGDVIKAVRSTVENSAPKSEQKPNK